MEEPPSTREAARLETVSEESGRSPEESVKSLLNMRGQATERLLQTETEERGRASFDKRGWTGSRMPDTVPVTSGREVFYA